MRNELLTELEDLVRETCLLWGPGWVTFNWRNYTFDHVQRVRGLAMTLCLREGGDALVTELAALLHDITKPFDGEYRVDAQGQRVVDEQGYWHNEVRLPPRRNHIVELYEALGLEGQLHNESGAAIAERLLAERGLPEGMSQRVAQTIRDHLRPPDDAPIASRCLYDADTLDANIGLPAFVRNIYIRRHYHDQRKSADAPTAAWLLQQAPLDYLQPYIVDNLPPWVAGKRRDFVPRLLTESAREVALARLERLEGLFTRLAQDVQAFGNNGQGTCLDVVLHYTQVGDDPSIAEETERLASTCCGSHATQPAIELIGQIRREMAGEE